MEMAGSASELDLPGFRFHPTEEELLDFYLRRIVLGKKLNVDIIGTLNLYRHDPWELPGLAKIGEREWYFFVPRDRKNANGGRPNRTTETGFWKATGSDRHIRSVTDPKRLIGLKKTLVFYRGRAPRGCKTDWVMNEYRLPETCTTTSPPKEDIVLCKIYRKATSLKELEQRAAMEEDARASLGCASTAETLSWSDHDNFQKWPPHEGNELKETKVEVEKEVEAEVSSVVRPMDEAVRPMDVAAEMAMRSLPELEVQVPLHGNLDWMQDPFLTQLRSPWFEDWSLYSNSLNF